MKAANVMVSPVITAKPDFTISQVAKLLTEHSISALPVVDDNNHVIGMVSEGDLLHRAEIGTARSPSWWLSMLTSDEVKASSYIKQHALKVGDVMTRNVISAKPDTPLSEIAVMLEKNAIKRVPILDHDVLVGIVSRANLVQALAAVQHGLDVQPSDATIRERLLAHLKAQSWAHTQLINVTVRDGVVDLWALAGSDTERQAIRVAAESMEGVRSVNDHMYERNLRYGYE
jgi:CBS-domain-containing membrane protein